MGRDTTIAFIKAVHQGKNNDEILKALNAVEKDIHDYYEFP